MQGKRAGGDLNVSERSPFLLRDPIGNFRSENLLQFVDVVLELSGGLDIESKFSDF